MKYHKYLYSPGDDDNIEYPRENEESSIEYIHRLLSLQEERTLKQLKASYNLNSFSAGLGTKVSENFRRASEIADAFRIAKEQTVKPITFDTIVRPSIPDVLAFEKAQAAKQREPFNELGKRLDLLVGVSKQAMEYTADSQKIQLQIAEEIKAGGETTDKHAKINIALTGIVIVLTIVLAAWSSMSGITFSSEQQKAMDGYSSSIVSSLNMLNKNLEERDNAISGMLAEIQALKGREQDYQHRIEALELELRSLKEQKAKN